MSHTHAIARPGTVLTVVVLTWVQAAIDIIAGVALMIVSADANALADLDAGRGAVLTAGIVTTVFGILVGLLAMWLNAGAPAARMTVSVVMAIQIVGGIVGLFSFGMAQISESIVTVLIAIGVLALLWSQKANEYFTS
jgi:hypothetical protein